MTTPDDLRGGIVPVAYALAWADGDGAPWHVQALEVREALSELYEVRLELVSGEFDVSDPMELLERRCVVHAARGALSRRLCGLVRSVDDAGQLGTRQVIRAALVPALWSLTQRVHNRVFQDVTALDVVREVLRDAGVYQGSDALRVAVDAAALPMREYCVQHRETDYAFVSRLLEDEGITFFFEHDGDEERLVLADASAPGAFRDHAAPLAVYGEHLGTAEREGLSRFDTFGELRPTAVTVRDYDFTQPDALDAMTVTQGPADGPRGALLHPGRFTLSQFDGAAYNRHDGARRAAARLQAEQVRGRFARGAGNAIGLAAGTVIELQGHRRPQLDGRYLVVRVDHAAAVPESLGDETAEARYANLFECVPVGAVYRPPLKTAAPVIHGAQTAVVSAEPGSTEEICVDPHGRVLVRFHWDKDDWRTQAQRGRRASCWVRVAQAWSGPGFGAQVTPRVGMEVLVTFVDGNPDRPIVTGCVPNATHPPPVDLRANKTRSTFRTNSSPGGGGYNELRFEDLKDQEEVFFHAQRDYNAKTERDASASVGRHEKADVGVNRTASVGNNETASVGNDQSLSVGNNQTLDVGNDQTVHVSANQTLTVDADQAISVGGHRTKTVTGDETMSVAGKQVEAITGNRATSVSGNDQSAVTGNQRASVGGNRTESVGGNAATTVTGDETRTISGSLTENVSGAASQRVTGAIRVSGAADVTMNAGANLHLVAASEGAFQGATIHVTASGEIVLSAGGSSIKISGAGVEINGATVKAAGGSVELTGGIVKIN